MGKKQLLTLLNAFSQLFAHLEDRKIKVTYFEMPLPFIEAHKVVIWCTEAVKNYHISIY